MSSDESVESASRKWRTQMVIARALQGHRKTEDLSEWMENQIRKAQVNGVFTETEASLWTAYVKDDKTGIKQAIVDGADMNKSIDGRSFFEDVVGDGRFELAELLIENKGDVTKCSPDVMFAIAHDKKNLGWLIDHKVDVDVRNASQETLLMHAVEAEKPEAVELLLNKRADRNLKNARGQTALELANELYQSPTANGVAMKTIIHYLSVQPPPTAPPAPTPATATATA